MTAGARQQGLPAPVRHRDRAPWPPGTTGGRYRNPARVCSSRFSVGILLSPVMQEKLSVMHDPDSASVRSSLGRNLTQGMVDTLGRAIVTGAYDGKRFPTEAELALQHGVSRSVTREAVKMLTAKGLLSARPRQGTIMEPARLWNLFDTDVLGWLLDRRFTLALLRQFNELRLGIEPVAARLAAERADQDGIIGIRAGYARMVKAEAGKDNPLDADIAFHVAVLRATGNPFYEQFEDLVSTALQSSIRFTNRFKGRSADLSAHGQVLQCIERADGGGAAGAMNAIIADVLALIAAHRSEHG